MTGMSVSPGYAEGRALIYRHAKLVPDERIIAEAEAPGELEAFAAAKLVAKEQIEALREKARKVLSPEESKVFDAHLLVLQDTALQKAVTAIVETEHRTAEYAVHAAMEQICTRLMKTGNALLQERVIDIRDVCMRILHILCKVEKVDLSSLDEDTILVAEDLTPSDTVQIDLARIKAIVTELGGKTSHTAILARSLELPAVVGVQEATRRVQTGQRLLVDGVSGVIHIDPAPQAEAEFRAAKEVHDREKEELKAYITARSETADGHPLEISANIGSAREAQMALAYGPDGVGLLRTEFLFMGKQSMPSEEEQLREYKKVAELMGNRPVIVRTLDIGGDKALPYIDFGEEENPFLGWRAIRMCLDMESVFLTQLKAILRAGVYGSLRIMYPMVINLDELRRANAILEQARQQLAQEGKEFDADIPVGVMIETPAAALIADYLAEEADFFSIGTNDLTQYTLAVDRGNEKIAGLYKSYHPAVLRLVRQVCDAAHAVGKWAGMCGELAGDERMAAMLVGLGVDELSMSASSIPRVRRALGNVTLAQARQTAEAALACRSADEVLQCLSARVAVPANYSQE